MVYSRANGAEKRISVADAERLMLWPAGVTDGWCAKVQTNHSRALRMKMLGNAISGQHLREILTVWNSTTEIRAYDEKHIERVDGGA